MERINDIVALCVRDEASCPSGFWHATFISLLQESIYGATLPISSTAPQGVLPSLYGPLWCRGGVSITLLWDETPAWAESLVRSPWEHRGPRLSTFHKHWRVALILQAAHLFQERTRSVPLRTYRFLWSETLQGVPVVPPCPSPSHLAAWEPREQLQLKPLHQAERQSNRTPRLWHFVPYSSDQ